jgi:membrane-associated phospholipid phosphatase
VSSGAEAFGRRAACYLRLSVSLAMLFIVTYGSTNWLSGLRSHLFRLHFDWELGIPFVPWMVYVYLSINLFLALPLFVLNTGDIRRLAKVFGMATLAGALAHLLLPAQLGWERPLHVAGYPVLAWLFVLDRPHNLVPSLHVGYSVLVGAVVWRRAGALWLRVVVGMWMALLVMSVLLAHQHHLVDVVSGVALGVVCYCWFEDFLA